MSLTRALQFEIIKSYPLKGRVLDVGGGEKVNYRSFLRCEHYESVNIDQGADPTWRVDISEAFPCPAEAFDTVISFNTLEHIFDAHFVLNEMHRALKPGGQIVLATPFLYPIHGHPDDFFRPTPSWYHQALGTTGFEQIEVVPLSWGALSTGSVCSGLPGPAKNIRRQAILILDLLYHLLWSRKKTRSAAETALHFNQIATAFFVRAIKS